MTNERGPLVSFSRLSVVGNSMSIEQDKELDVIYVTFCGDPEKIVKLIQDTLDIAKEALPAGEYIDNTFKGK